MLPHGGIPNRLPGLRKERRHEGSRVYLKTENVTGSEGFLR